jgi:hypothetical protein
MNTNPSRSEMKSSAFIFDTVIGMTGYRFTMPTGGPVFVTVASLTLIVENESNLEYFQYWFYIYRWKDQVIQLFFNTCTATLSSRIEITVSLELFQSTLKWRMWKAYKMLHSSSTCCLFSLSQPIKLSEYFSFQVKRPTKNVSFET